MADPVVQWADVVAIAPELDATPEDAQTAYLAMARRLCNATAWGDLYSDGVRYLAAHLATIGRNKGRGPVTAESVGQLSRSYGNMTALAGTWGASSYGAHYYQLTRMLPTVLGAVY